MNKDAEVRKVAQALDALMDDLDATVAALNEILTRPADPPAGSDERLVAP